MGKSPKSLPNCPRMSPSHLAIWSVTGTPAGCHGASVTCSSQHRQCVGELKVRIDVNMAKLAVSYFPPTPDDGE